MHIVGNVDQSHFSEVGMPLLKASTLKLNRKSRRQNKGLPAISSD
jgi:hypothetical protein